MDKVEDWLGLGSEVMRLKGLGFILGGVIGFCSGSWNFESSPEKLRFRLTEEAGTGAL